MDGYGCFIFGGKAGFFQVHWRLFFWFHSWIQDLFLTYFICLVQLCHFWLIWLKTFSDRLQMSKQKPLHSLRTLLFSPYNHLQLMWRSCHISAAAPAWDPWPSTARLWEKRSPWAKAPDWPGGRLPRSRTAWCLAAAQCRSRRGSAWSWWVRLIAGMGLCVWASPLWIQQPESFRCLLWLFLTSLKAQVTGLLLCLSSSARWTHSWSSGCLMEAPCTSRTRELLFGYALEWTSANHCGPWLTSMDRQHPSSCWVSSHTQSSPAKLVF